MTSLNGDASILRLFGSSLVMGVWSPHFSDGVGPATEQPLIGSLVLFKYPLTPLAASSTRIRLWRDDDLRCIEAASSDPHIAMGTTLPAAFTPEAGRSFLRRQQSRLTNSEGISQAIADRETDAAVGLIYVAARPQAWIAGIGDWLIPEARGQNRATTAVDLVSDWALRELKVARIEAWVTPDNVSSQRVLERSGFALEGRLRNFLRVPAGFSDGLVFSRCAPDRVGSTVKPLYAPRHASSVIGDSNDFLV